MKKKNCKQCNKSIVALRSTKKFCSDLCGLKYRYVKKTFTEIQCLNCQKTFMPTKSNQKFCEWKTCGKSYTGKIKRKELREQIFQMYGTECACCGENQREFLTIEHIDGGGREHRKGRGSESFYREIASEYRPDLYEILCMNCNHARGIYGFCPHELD